MGTSSLPLPGVSFSWPFRAVVKAWAVKAIAKNWECLFIVSTLEDFIGHISGRQNKNLRKALATVDNCSLVPMDREIEKVLPHPQENRMGCFSKSSRNLSNLDAERNPSAFLAPRGE